ncbi:hypothetical protein ACFVSX_02550 [Streptomyces rubiginosohelvolus]|uniref:hypothetical protein n=1 Tax=Streptomyces rubiginosohelvolus TaxID=67362 RepID=UPI0036DBBDA3
MLQCTAVTLLPPDAVLRLTAPGTDSPEDPEPYVLCELGEHDVTDPLGDLIAERLVSGDSPEG